MNQPVPSRQILGVRVDATNYDDIAQQITGWARNKESRSVFVCNVHMIMEAHDAPPFRQAINEADLVTPDGMPLVWALKAQGIKHATRADGSGIVARLLEEAANKKIPIALYGGTEQSVAAFQQFAHSRHPEIEFVAAILPPFRPLSDAEDAVYTRQLANSGARLVFVSLGCPKQEQWIAAHRGQILAVLIGVGAAIDFHGGTVPRAPRWMQRVGLEWLFRLCQEPRRLWKRYLIHNPRFVVLFLCQLTRNLTNRPTASF
jgi:N-acetylglucosaminyldiphosphoundecaprenol N-acetyl-beta-D-mannosaminyltransferase